MSDVRLFITLTLLVVIVLTGHSCYILSMQAPFCVHPKTGKVCVPIEPGRAYEFDPDTVPTVESLLRELEEHGQPQPGDKVRLGPVL